MTANKVAGKPIPAWIITDHRGRVVFETRAHTKSEARAHLKRHCGIPRKGRLAVGTVLRRKGAKAS